MFPRYYFLVIMGTTLWHASLERFLTVIDVGLFCSLSDATLSSTPPDAGGLRIGVAATAVVNLLNHTTPPHPTPTRLGYLAQPNSTPLGRRASQAPHVVGVPLLSIFLTFSSPLESSSTNLPYPLTLSKTWAGSRLGLPTAGFFGFSSYIYYPRFVLRVEVIFISKVGLKPMVTTLLSLLTFHQRG